MAVQIGSGQSGGGTISGVDGGRARQQVIIVGRRFDKQRVSRNVAVQSGPVRADSAVGGPGRTEYVVGVERWRIWITEIFTEYGCLTRGGDDDVVREPGILIGALSENAGPGDAVVIGDRVVHNQHSDSACAPVDSAARLSFVTDDQIASNRRAPVVDHSDPATQVRTVSSDHVEFDGRGIGSPQGDPATPMDAPVAVDVVAPDHRRRVAENLDPTSESSASAAGLKIVCDGVLFDQRRSETDRNAERLTGAVADDDVAPDDRRGGGDPDTAAIMLRPTVANGESFQNRRRSLAIGKRHNRIRRIAVENGHRRSVTTSNTDRLAGERDVLDIRARADEHRVSTCGGRDCRAHRREGGSRIIAARGIALPIVINDTRGLREG